MGTKCKAGDIAVILTQEDEYNAGLIVSVVRPDDGSIGDFNYEWTGLTWWVKSVSPLKWSTLEDSDLITSMEGPMPDAVLFPIRGPRDDVFAISQEEFNDDYA